MARISAACNDKQIILCPFGGVVGNSTECGIPPDFCENWNHDGGVQTGCDIELTFTHVPGECAVTITVTTPAETRILTLDTEIFNFSIVPCDPGETATVTIVRTWDPTCIHGCKSNDGTETLMWTAT
jgi:hypothetical protein